MAQAVADQHGWQLAQTRFYTGIPEAADNKQWHHFWVARLLTLSRGGAHVFSRPLRYRRKRFMLPDGTPHYVRVGEEKGIDVRIALDIVQLAYAGDYDVALVFSQDQDLSEAADDVRLISRREHRWLKVVSAFPVGPNSHNRRGINDTDWVRVNRTTYDACLDPRDYRRQ